VWRQELIDGYASNAATISTNRRAVSSPRRFRKRCADAADLKRCLLRSRRRTT
jgi:hypothetical protein